MKRFHSFTHHNQWQLLPSICVTAETPYYLYLDIQWLRWGVTFVVYDRQTN